MILFDGKKHAEMLDNILKKQIASNNPKGKLLIVLIGDNLASEKYISVKMALCEKLGVPVQVERISAQLSDDEILAKVSQSFNDPEVSGGIIQLPLPRTQLKKIFEKIPSEKDCDLLLSTVDLQYMLSTLNRSTPVVRGALYFISQALYPSAIPDYNYVNLLSQKALLQQKRFRKKVYIIGNGFLVGKPIASVLGQLNFDVIVDRNYAKGTKIYSDFLVLGAGVPNLVNGEDISENCNVLDFGISVLDGKVVGDLNKNTDCTHLGLVSFTPGGIGPVVVRFLLMNFLNI